MGKVEIKTVSVETLGGGIMRIKRIKQAKKLNRLSKVAKRPKATSVNELNTSTPKVGQRKKSQKKAERDETKTVKYVRKLQLCEANAEEDKTIKKLEKALKLTKRKKRGKQKEKKEAPKIPDMFVDDGLDYILDVLDKREGSGVSGLDMSDAETMDEEGIMARGAKSRLMVADSSKPQKPRRLADLLKERGEEDEEANFSDKEESVEEDDELSSFDDGDSESESMLCNDDAEMENETAEAVVEDKESNEKPKIWEDIYGRLRDQDGNVIKSDRKTGMYVPPAKREALKEGDGEKVLLSKITRQLNGPLNSLNESNMRSISFRVEEIYMKYSRNDMNETLMTLISKSVMTPILAPFKLALDQAMLIALLHANVGPEVGAYFLQTLAVKFNDLLKLGENYGEGKICNNILVFLSHLYTFKVTHCTLIFDILKHLIESFQDKDIELIHLLLKNVGFALRKNDPLKLKEIFLLIQAKAPSFKSKENSLRVQFMVDTLTAIRNNNMYKIPDYDPSIIEHARKVLRCLIRSGASVQELAITFEDLLKAEERGRWWIVGSSWSERETTEKSETTSSDSTPLPRTNISEKILELARLQHMNTGTRKTIFCIIMTAEDYLDAFEKLLRLNLKNQQEREIINVLLHCTLQEKKFNPYYAFLAGKFCKFARKYYMNLQFTLWDKFKELQTLKPQQISNLAHFLVHLFTRGDLPISVLKVIHFSEMDKIMVKFFRQILLGILLHDSAEVCSDVFKRVAASKSLSLLREGLRLFMHHFLLQNSCKFEPSVMEKLSKRVKQAENALNSEKYAFKL